MRERIKVCPTEWLSRGDAVAYRENDGKPLVIWGGIPGEDSVVEVEHVGQNRVFGTWVGSKKPDPNRVEPPCERYNGCGGCSLMHLNEKGQSDAHYDIVRLALDSEQLQDVNISKHYPSPDGLSDFRFVVKLGVGLSDHGHLRVGAWGRGSRNIIPIPKCQVAAPILRRTMNSVAHFVIEHNLQPYTAHNERGILRSVVLRASRTTGEVMVTLIAGKRDKGLLDFAEDLAQSATEIAGVWLHVNPAEGNAIFTRSPTGDIVIRRLVGSPTIKEKIGDVVYEIGPGDFFQTNPSTAKILYERTLERLSLDEDSAFLDLYCGVGGLALQAAKTAGWVLGVEEADGAVQRARDAARKNNLSIDFISERVIWAVEDIKQRLKGLVPVISVNPARRGLEDGVVDAIVDLNPRTVAYISCNPRAMAEDLKLFMAKGYEIGDVEVFEMFPNTAHMECLVVLTNPAAGEQQRRVPKRKVAR
jgi:23S rRNA (uracil1939-C5)-methyltransferase